jgi:hypothetical protein
MVVDKENLENTCALIVLDFDQPWEMMNALNRWLGILSDVILNALKTLPLKEQDKLKERTAMHIKDYDRAEDTTKQENPKKNGKKRDSE